MTKDFKQYKNMKKCLLAMSKGKIKCDVDYPNFRKIKSEIIAIDLTNIDWKPIKVQFLESGLLETTESYEEIDLFGWNNIEPLMGLVTKQTTVTESWVMLEWLSNFE